MSASPTPLKGITVIEFTHMVMGPTVGHILAGLGAEIVRIEPIGSPQSLPTAGKDARAVLAGLGYDAGRIEALLPDGAVGES